LKPLRDWTRVEVVDSSLLEIAIMFSAWARSSPSDTSASVFFRMFLLKLPPKFHLSKAGSGSATASASACT